MSEEIKSSESKEESFEELLDKSFKTLNTGEKVTGIVTAITSHRGSGGPGLPSRPATSPLSELTD